MAGLCRRVRVRLLRHNDGLPLVVAAVKTSAGRVRVKGIEYYLTDYVERKRGNAVKILREAMQWYPSVLEHFVMTVYIEGCSRVCTHQLVRHRLASYTQESQRYSVAVALESVPDAYVEAAGGDRLRGLAMWMQGLEERARELLADNPPEGEVEKLREELEPIVVIPPTLRGRPLVEYLYSIASSLRSYASLILAGTPYEDARYLLPSSMRTRILVTANLREWIHIIKLRTSPAAQWEIRCVMEKVKEEIARVAPVF